MIRETLLEYTLRKKRECQVKYMPSRRGFSDPAPFFFQSEIKEQVSQGAFQAPVHDKNLIVFKTHMYQFF